MLKRTAALSIVMVWTVGLYAQSEPERIYSIFYMKAKTGKENQLVKGMTEHSQKFHSDGEWPEYVHEVIAGERTGQYFHFTSGHRWTDFDKRVRSEKDVKHWQLNMLPYIDENASSLEVSYVAYVPELSLPYEANYNMYRVTYFYVRPGKDADFTYFIGRANEAHKKLKDGHKHHFYKNVIGGEGGVYASIHPLDKFEGMYELGSVMRKAFDEKELKRLQSILNGAVKKITSELRKVRPDLSSKN